MPTFPQMWPFDRTAANKVGGPQNGKKYQRLASSSFRQNWVAPGVKIKRKHTREKKHKPKITSTQKKFLKLNTKNNEEAPLDRVHAVGGRAPHGADPLCAFRDLACPHLRRPKRGGKGERKVAQENAT